eukprot:TRINITY_DN14876_c0_g1_i1.p1 TRINITY_DN14876_c0_g1~~TRINITY_DN14876_c0_g1_i1.p1  ORF type:complete len:218 (+),score=34.91 TRINITY_DN14876_c0_g1_i1:238-891(+)
MSKHKRSRSQGVTPMHQFCPPATFGIVEADIYRTNVMHPINFSYVEGLHIKTVLNLSHEAPTRSSVSFFREHNINHLHLGLKTWRPDTTWKPVTEELVKDALEIVLNVNSHPVMIMCTSGVHQSGVVVGCLRKLQNWNLTSILQEYRSYGHYTHSLNEQFIELFDTDLVTLPRSLPQWFIDQRKMMNEEKGLTMSDEYRRLYTYIPEDADDSGIRSE